MLPLTEQINYQALTYEVERQEISNLVRNRLQDLGIPSNDYGKKVMDEFPYINDCLYR